MAPRTNRRTSPRRLRKGGSVGTATSSPNSNTQIPTTAGQNGDDENQEIERGNEPVTFNLQAQSVNDVNTVITQESEETHNLVNEPMTESIRRGEVR